MKKKQTEKSKKLVLAKETLTNLSSTNLKEIHGGIVSFGNCHSVANGAC